MNIRWAQITVFCFLALARGQWTELITYDLSPHERAMASVRQGVTLQRRLNMHATQLIISWNALRPKNGYFSLYVRVYEAPSRTWSRWYKMADWGAGVQRTYLHSSRHVPSFEHVRLEMPRGRQTDLCEVKVVAFDGANLNDLYRLSISAADYRHFISQVCVCRSFSWPSVLVEGVPVRSQMCVNHPDVESICSPTSLSMLIAYLMNRPEDPAACARAVYDHGLRAYGSWPLNVAHAFDRCQGAYYFAVTRLDSFAVLYDYLRAGIPVVVSVRGKIETMPPGHAYAKGHLLVVVGWDNRHKQVLCHDPAFASDELVAHAYPVLPFVAAWERSYRLAYVAKKREHSDTQ